MRCFRVMILVLVSIIAARLAARADPGPGLTGPRHMAGARPGGGPAELTFESEEITGTVARPEIGAIEVFRPGPSRLLFSPPTSFNERILRSADEM